MTTKLYKDGDHMAIYTECLDERAFLEEISTIWDDLIDEGVFDNDWEFQFNYWLPQIVDICCKYRGYKNNVHVKRILIAGSPNLRGMEPVASYVSEDKYAKETTPDPITVLEKK